MDIIDKVKSFFKKKSKIKAIVLDEVGKIHIKKVPYSNNTFTLTFNGEKQAYTVDHNFVTYDAKSNMPTSFYHINNPEPIRMKHERNTEMDSISFKKILDSKVITDLFSPEGKNLLTILMILIVVNLALTGLLAAIQFKIIKVD